MSPTLLVPTFPVFLVQTIEENGETWAESTHENKMAEKIVYLTKFWLSSGSNWFALLQRVKSCYVCHAKKEMMFSVRIVNSDFYLADPIANLDAGNSKFREDATVSKVPVIRIYGATPSGQKTCLHVHGIFPYIYVPYDGTQPTDKYLKQFATSVDFAVQVALGRASSSRQHVFEITVVKGM